MHSIFISDLHLCAERSHINQQFFDFIERTASQARALYILGDLFEYWAGDDDLADPFHASVAQALRSLGAQGTSVYVMHGNRDLLIGREFAQRCGAQLIPDPTLLDLEGTPTLIMHGDTLCTDDTEYQKFRAHARNPDYQAQFLAQPLATRREQILDLRAQSERSKQNKSNEIMDVSQSAVAEALRSHGYPRLIHGHTHRPARHVHTVDSQACERWVLNDWYQRGGYLRCDASGCRLITL